MAEGRLNRIISQVWQWRSSDRREEAPSFSASLDESDIRRLRRMIDECIDGRGGEIAARKRATAIGGAFLDLDDVGQRRFFELLADDYDHDDHEVDQAIARVIRATDRDSRRSAEHHLISTLKPRRERLLRRFVGLEGGLLFLIHLREQLLPLRRDSSSLAALDHELKVILTSWFDVALLRLEQLGWDSPASLLEKLIEYEAVHAIESWEDLRGRLGPARRCYAFLHPSMPGEPLIFVEVALTHGISDALPPLLDHSQDRIQAGEADTAIFYSISNCHRGLAGVPLGDLLIKQVVERLSAELPNLTTFSTLSPIPGFRSWLNDHVDDPDLLTDDDIDALGDGDAERARQALADLLEMPAPATSAPIDHAEETLLGLAARYLVLEGQNRALDPVAHFHLSNGSWVERVNWWANPGLSGWDRSLALMANYRYRLESIEENHDSYGNSGQISTSSAVDRLLADRRPD